MSGVEHARSGVVSLLFPFGLAALAALPAILALHFFRRRFPPRPIAGLFLWPRDARTPGAGRSLTRLVRSISLAAELLVAAALALLVAGLFWPRPGPVRHVTVVIDASASMGARGESGETFLAAGLAALEELLDDAGGEGGIRVAVLVSAPRPALIAGPAVEVGEALSAARRVVPAAPAHSLAPAIELARQVAGPAGAVVVLTDDPARAREGGAGEDEILSRGEALPNAAITLARREAASRESAGEDGSTRVLLVVRNFSGRDAARELTLGAGEDVWHREEVSLAARGSRELSFDVAAGADLVEARLSGDSLAIDDAAFLLPPRRRAVRVASGVEPGSRFERRVERACRAAGGIEWGGENVAGAHVVVGQGSAPPEDLPPRAWWVGFGTPPGVDPSAEPLPPLLGPYLADPSDSVAGGLDFRGVIWGGAHPWDGAGAIPLLMAGEHVLFARLRGRGREAYLFNLDPAKTNLHKSPAWPLFWNRLLEARRREFPGIERANYASGERARLALEGEEFGPPRTLILRSGSGEPRSVRVGGAGGFLPPVEEPGVYEVGEGDLAIDRFAVHFDSPAVSDLSRCARSTPELAAPGELEGREDLGRPWLWPAMLLVALLAAVGDWWVLCKGEGNNPLPLPTAGTPLAEQGSCQRPPPLFPGRA
ncbi:MAG: VWA domain-containing protein [Planctomycetes bacterium]|nr:VWA domain-containing protein [Planctomycetota bacterium]